MRHKESNNNRSENSIWFDLAKFKIQDDEQLINRIPLY
jgi:hypothetical protein